MKEWELENLKSKKQNSVSKYFLLPKSNEKCFTLKIDENILYFAIFMLLFRNILGKLNMINISYKLIEKAKLLNESGGCSR